MATCFGLYYSPLLPLITTVILVLTFYLQRLSLRINFADSKKTWTSSATRTVYLIISFLAVIIPGGFFALSITDKSYCGPFKDTSPISVTGIYESSDNREYATYWILAKGVWGIIAVSATIVFYYRSATPPLVSSPPACPRPARPASWAGRCSASCRGR
jgi:hypothetical protein